MLSFVGEQIEDLNNSLQEEYSAAMKSTTFAKNCYTWNLIAQEIILNLIEFLNAWCKC